MRGPVGLAVLATAFGLGAAAPATAQVAPDLDGELLRAYPAEPGTVREVSRACDPNGEASITLEVEGRATGPYPGMFRETFSAKLGPPGGAGLSSRPLIDAQASFTIAPLVGQDWQVSGTKRFVPGRTTASGTCFNDPRFPGDQSAPFFDAGGGSLAYEATIVFTPTCTFTDRGTASFDFFVFSSPTSPRESGFQELFFTDGSPPQGVGACAGDDDDDGGDDGGGGGDG
jgi:hypothetical protein